MSYNLKNVWKSKNGDINNQVEQIENELIEIQNNQKTLKNDLADVGNAITDNLNTFKQFKQNQEIINTKFSNDIIDLENFNEEFSKYYRRIKYDGVNNGNGMFSFSGLNKIDKWNTKWMFVIMLNYKKEKYITYTFNVILNSEYNLNSTILNLFYEDRWYNIPLTINNTTSSPTLYIDATSLNHNLGEGYTLDVWCIYTGRL